MYLLQLSYVFLIKVDSLIISLAPIVTRGKARGQHSWGTFKSDYNYLSILDWLTLMLLLENVKYIAAHKEKAGIVTKVL